MSNAFWKNQLFGTTWYFILKPCQKQMILRVYDNIEDRKKKEYFIYYAK